VPCLVLDPFAGTGTAVLAAVRLGRRALGCELNEAFARFGKQRVLSTVGIERSGG
jgi:DNA modification methylase